jgi:hypothetical protein
VERAKALWKLNRFLRDFGYDTELLARDEVDDKRFQKRFVVFGTAVPVLMSER